VLLGPAAGTGMAGTGVAGTGVAGMGAAGMGAVGPLAYSLVGVECEALDAVKGALDGGPVQAQPLGKIAESGLGLLNAGRGYHPNDIRLLGEASVRLQHGNRLEVARGGAHGPLQVGRLGVDNPIDVTPNRPGYLPRLHLQQRGATTHDPQERANCLHALPGDDATAAADAPGGGHFQLSKSFAQLSRFVGRKNELKVCSARRQTQRTVSQEPAAEVSDAAVIGSPEPIEPDRHGQRRARHGQFRGRGLLAYSTAAQPQRQPGDRPAARLEGSRQAGLLGDPTATPWRIDRG
jgi:hypothetical protein